ncbi:MAG: AraC family transcriptional regulator, partial [Comamonadaceae bacterium]
MPQQRTLLQTDAAWTVERVRKHAGPVQWSAPYEAASGRWVLPTDGLLEFQLAGVVVLLDGLTALCLPQGLAYQMRPLQHKDQTSIVASEGAAKPVALASAGPQVRALSPRAMWHLRTQWGLGGGTGPEGTSQALSAVLGIGLDAPAGRVPLPSVPQPLSAEPPSVACARRFMALQVGAASGERWSLRDVADVAGCSAFHLSHLFRRHLGQSLHGYRQRLRMVSALQRLQEGEADLAALAHDLGYCSQSHLGAVFRREVGVTLAQARA